MTKKCYVKFAGGHIKIDPKITFVLFNDLIEKNITFEFINFCTSTKQITYSFYIYNCDAAQAKKILKEAKKWLIERN